MLARSRSLALAVGLWAGPLAWALGAPALAPLPEPLTLGTALGLADSHPRPVADSKFSARFPRGGTLYLDCHRLAFGNAELDPGRSRPREALLEPRAAQRLEVLTRFFDALLADQAFATHSEAMAVAFIQFDRAAVRRDLGQTNELKVLELETVYQSVLLERAAAELSQQLARVRLVGALNRTEGLPRDLVAPELPVLPDPLPDAESLIRDSAESNPALRTLLDSGGEPERRLVLLELREQVLGLLLRLRALEAAGRQVRTESAYRDLKLDESRTLYDQEVTADLGYSMSQQTQTRMRETRIGYCRALAWAELMAIAGRPPWPLPETGP
jgi:hypothetical protein